VTQVTKKPTKVTTKAKTVAEYLKAAPKEQRAALVRLRSTIKAAAPDATEAISYGMAGYKYDGQYLLTFGYWRTHVAIYGSFGAHAAELRAYEQSGKGTFRFPADKPLPYGLVTKIVKTRVAEIKRAS
jgi:uncharacterized protein YdhG (YjbR/CyaY superfamily)